MFTPLSMEHNLSSFNNDIDTWGLRSGVMVRKVELHFGIGCRDVELWNEGAHHKIYRLLLVDGRFVICRIRQLRKELGAGVYPPDQMDSEIATMRYVKAHTAIPVPTVYLHDKDESNAVGGEWMAMEQVIGENMWILWPTLSREQRREGIKAMLSVWTTLMKLRFDSIGSIASPLNDPTIFTVGPLTFMPSDSDLTKAAPPRELCGPFSTSRQWLLAAARQDLKYIGAKPFTEDERIFIAQAIIAVEKAEFPPLDESPSMSDSPGAINVLKHLDLHPHNIIVDPQNPSVITGVIDWEGACIVPLWSIRPRFLGGGIRELTSDEDQVSELDQLCETTFSESVPFWAQLVSDYPKLYELSVRAHWSKLDPHNNFVFKL